MRSAIVSAESSIETWYSWAVCVALAYTNAVVFGWTFVSSILLEELIKYYQNDPDVVFKASWVISVQSAVACCGSMFAAYLLRQFGVRPVSYVGVLLITLSVAVSPLTGSVDWWYLTYSVLNGFGCSITYMTFCVVQPMYFDLHRGLNFGIMCLASGAASFIYPPIFSALRSVLDFPSALLVVAGIFASTAVSFTFMRPRQVALATQSRYVEMPETDGGNDAEQTSNETAAIGNDNVMSTSDRERIIDRESESNDDSRCARLGRQLDVHLLRSRSFVLIAVAIALIGCGTSIPQVHLISFATIYYPNEPVNLLLSAMGATACVAKLISAALVDRLSLRWTLYLIQLGPVCCMVVIVVATVLVANSAPFAVLMTACALYGVFEGPSIAPIYPFVCRIVPLNEIGSANAYMRVLMGIGGLIGPPIGGAIYTALLSYPIAFYIAAVPVFVGSLMMFFATDLNDYRPSVKPRSSSAANYVAEAGVIAVEPVTS